MHPLGLTDDWSDKLKGRSFTHESNGITYEHYLQVGRRGCLQGLLSCVCAAGLAE